MFQSGLFWDQGLELNCFVENKNEEILKFVTAILPWTLHVIKSRMNSKGVWVSKAKVLKSLDILLYLISLLSESWCLQNNRTLFHRRLQHKGKIFHWDLHEGFRMCQSSVLNCSSFWFTETKKKQVNMGYRHGLQET